MTVWVKGLVPGWYRIPRTSRLVLLCADCAERRDLWFADRLSSRHEGDHDDCHDCGRTVE